MLVDDEQQILINYASILRSGGFNNVISCSDSSRLMALISRKGAEIILLDLSMPHISGDELLPQIIHDFPEIPVVVVTGNDNLENAVQCIKGGAFDYLTKPLNKERLLTTVKQAITFRDLNRENLLLKDRFLTDQLEYPQVFAPIVTNNRAIKSIFKYVEAIAKTSQPVLITGETGVGKELLVKALHETSQRKGSLVSVNVAGLDDNTFSDTLFGHKKGAFTGANKNRKGIVEQAVNGTLFLDEIGDLSEISQVKLLRLLQEREYFPLGVDQPKSMYARMVVATNQELNVLQKSGKFRKDLYFRLCAHHIHIPPLRERLDDLPLLLDSF